MCVQVKRNLRQQEELKCPRQYFGLGLLRGDFNRAQRITISEYMFIYVYDAAPLPHPTPLSSGVPEIRGAGNFTCESPSDDKTFFNKCRSSNVIPRRLALNFNLAQQTGNQPLTNKVKAILKHP